MSTYTDLNNRIKENITVGYPQNDRITTQKVRLFNEENEYWGTFKGHVTAEDITINGGQINGAVLSDVTLCGNISLSGVDIPKIGGDIRQLCAEIQGVQSNLDDETRDRMSADAKLKHLIMLSDSRVAELCASVYEDLSAETAARILADETETAARVSAVSAEADARAKADAALHGEIADLNVALNAETQERMRQDELIRDYAESVNVSSKNRFVSAMNALSAHEADNVEQFANLFVKLADRIEHERHYVIWGQNEEILKRYPYRLRDFATNIIKTSIKDGIVVDREFENASVAWISRGDGDQATVQFYDLTQDPRLQDAVKPNQVFSFDGAETKPTYKNNYQISYYPGDKILLTTDPNEFFEVRANKSGDIIGKIKDFKANADGTIISGRITIDTEDSQLTAFNGFQDREFSVEQRVLSNETEQVVFNADNKTFKLRKGVTDVYYCPVNTATGTVAQIIEGNVKYDGSTLLEIDVTIGEDVVPLRSPSFQTDFGAKTMSCDTVARTFSLFDRHAYYKYGYYLGSDESFAGKCFGYVIPAQENTYIEPGDYSQVSVVIQGQKSTAVNGTYLLDLDPTFAVKTWKEVADLGDGNFVTIRYDGKYVLLDGIVDGTPFGPGKYLVDKSKPEIYNPDTAFSKRWTSTYTDWTKFEEHTTREAAVYGTTTNGPKRTPVKQYKLDITTEGCDEITVCVPPKKFSDNAREFMLVEKITSGADRKIKLNVVKEDGVTPAEFFAERKGEIYVWTNRWTSFQFDEIAADRFFVYDMDQNNQGAQIKDLYEKLQAEAQARTGADAHISGVVDQHSLSVADIYDRIKGGLRYKGQVCVTDVPLSVLEDTYQFCPTSIKDLFALDVGEDIYEALKEKGWERPDSAYTLDTELQAGYMYSVKAHPNTTTVRFHLSGEDGVGIEVAAKDYIIIRTPGAENNKVKIRDLSSVNIDVIDSEDTDVVHTPLLSAISSEIALSVGRVSSDINAVSSDLTAEHQWVDQKFVKLSADQELSGNMTYLGRSKFIGESDFNGGLSARSLSADAVKLGDGAVNSLTVLQKLVVTEAETQVIVDTLSAAKLSALDADIDNLSSSTANIAAVSADALTASDVRVGSFRNIRDGISSIQDVIDLSVDSLSTSIKALSDDIGAHKSFVMEFRGDISANPAIDRYDSLSAWMKESVVLDSDHKIKLGFKYRVSSPVKFETFSGFDVNDYIIVNKDVTLETIDFADIYVQKDYDDETSFLSAVCDRLNSDTGYISGQIQLSVSNIESEIALSVGNLESEIALSVGNLESEIALSVARLSSDTEDLSVEYHNTFVDFDRRDNNHISSDNLVVTDPYAHTGSRDEHDRYYMTMKYGTLVMKKIEPIVPKNVFVVSSKEVEYDNGFFGSELNGKTQLLKVEQNDNDYTLQEIKQTDSQITSLADYSFYKCRNLTDAACEYIKTVGAEAFHWCTSLSSVSLPHATDISYNAFYQCNSLSLVSLPQATSIGDFAFYDCHKLSSVSLPQATSIGDKAFNQCTSLSSVDFGTTLTIVPSIYSTSFNDISHPVSCYVPNALLEDWKNATNWSSLIAENKVVLIGQ